MPPMPGGYPYVFSGCVNRISSSINRLFMGSGPAQNWTQLQASKLPAPALPHEDERRTELVADVEAAVLVLVYSLGALAAHHNSRVPVGAHLHLIQPESLVPEAPGIVAGEPLAFGQREAAG